MTLLTSILGYQAAPTAEPTPSPEQKKLLGFLAGAKGPVLSKDVAVFFNIAPQSVRRKIQPYLDAGWVERRPCRSHGSATVKYILAGPRT